MSLNRVEDFFIADVGLMTSFIQTVSTWASMQALRRATTGVPGRILSLPAARAARSRARAFQQVYQRAV